jgi:hypothetical protein
MFGLKICHLATLLQIPKLWRLAFDDLFFSALVGGMAKKILLAQRPLLENLDLIRRKYFGG